MRTAIGDGDEPAEFARQTHQRLRIVASAEYPESGTRRAIVNPNASLFAVDRDVSIDANVLLERETGQRVQLFIHWIRCQLMISEFGGKYVLADARARKDSGDCKRCACGKGFVECGKH